MDVIIRKATPKDTDAIYGLVKELAAYEKEPHEVWSDESNYAQDFKDEWYDSIVAEHDGKVVGMMLFFKTYSSWKGRMLYLDDFVITEAYRRKGIGKLLFDELINVAKSWGVNIVKWQVLDWNQPAIDFYEKYQAHFDKGWYNCKLLKDQIEAWK